MGQPLPAMSPQENPRHNHGEVGAGDAQFGSEGGDRRRLLNCWTRPPVYGKSRP